MTSFKSWLLAAALGVWAAPALANLNVFATVPEWGALVEELGGDKVKVYTATNALQDPHHVEAKPSLIARARGADLVVATGAELEIGWLPLVTQQAGNPKVQAGKPGYFEAASFVTILDKPARLDRAEGDVHAAGDPHIQTDPRNIARVAGALSARLAELDPENAAHERGRLARTEAWRRADHRPSLRSNEHSPTPTGEDGDPRGVSERSRLAMDCRAREDQCGCAAIHRRQ